MSQAAQAVRGEWVEIDVHGTPMECYLAKPFSDRDAVPETRIYPAVIVFMEIFGVNSHIRDVTERLAAEGYVAIAPNYYHRTTRNLELDYTESGMTEGRRHKEAATRDGLLVDIRAVIEFLKNQANVAQPERMGCVGFCFGGHVATIAAGFYEIAATASFYPGGVATSSPGGGRPTITHASEIQGEILFLFGEQDPLIPREDMTTVEEALGKARIRYEVVRYPEAGHGFCCDQRADYNPQAAQDAWRRVLALFERNLKQKST